MQLSSPELRLGSVLTVSVELVNYGDVAATEVVQMYIRDLVGSVTRPVKELKGFKRVRLEPGQREVVEFQLHSDELAFYGRDMKLKTEPGSFHVWIGGSSDSGLWSEFRVVDSD
jgi:beta-glucosidase